MHEHMKGWVKAGHRVTLFASRFKGSAEGEKLDGIEILRRGHQYLGVQLASFFYYVGNQDKYDFVVDQFHGIPFFTPLYSRKPKLAVIQETARKVWFLNPLPWPLDWLVGVIGYLGEPFLFLPYRRTHFMTGSASAKNDVSRFGIPRKNITVVPHGIIIKKPTPFPGKERKKTIVYLGVLSKDKGIQDALRTFALLKDRDEFQFWVIGRSETEKYGNKVHSLIKTLKLESDVRFWGFVSQEKKFELLARAHILINPSVREGWGLVNIEANRMGTPVVAYRSPGIVDSVKDGQSGILCRENTPQVLAKNIFRLLNGKNEYSRLQNGAIVWSKKFSWEKSRKQSLSLLEKVAHKK